jgi:uncharacterized membrane protein
MDIFLLFVILTLVIIFHLVSGKRSRDLHQRIENLQKQLAHALKQFQDKPIVMEKVVETEKKEEERIIVPEIKVEDEKIEEEKPIIEEIIPPVEEKKITPKIEPVVVESTIPIIENPVKQQNVLPPIPKRSFVENFKERNPDLEKFIGENLLSKIAITILVLGIAFFVKYAIDKEWIPEAGRVGIGILTGAIIMGFAHKLHKKFKPFSSVLVAGAIAVFYFTIGIGFHQYHLFSQTVAFIIMLVITGFSVFLSILYDRVELAALSLVGGFAVPLMVATGAGNYKIYFTYMLILDCGMLVLAYMKKWNLINILAYVFTVFFYTAWLASAMKKENTPYAGAFLFGCIFYILFIIMNVINNLKERRKFTYVELIILISNSFVFYISGMLILKEWAWQYKGVYTVAMGGLNFFLAYLVNKRHGSDKKLAYLLIGLSLTFATLAAPVQLKGSYITLFWAAESVMLIWLSQRTQLKAFKFASIFVIFSAFISLIIDWSNVYGESNGIPAAILWNKAFVTGIFTAICLFASIWLLKREEKETQGRWFNIDPKVYANILSVTFIIVLYVTGMCETVYQVDKNVYSGDSKGAIVFFYHLAFSAILSFFFLKNYSLTKGVLNFILICLNALIFCSAFCTIPYSEIKERCWGTHESYLAYVFHFGALLAMIIHYILTHRSAIRQNNFIMSAKGVMLWLAALVLVIAVSNEVSLNFLVNKMKGFVRQDYYLVDSIYDFFRVQVMKVAWPVAWGAIAFIFLNIGIKKQIRQMRIIALVLLAITLMKLFFYDIKDVSEAGKIIAFILLGVLLLVMSFMYQKIKAILSDDPTKTASVENKDSSNNSENENQIP